jgi:hypothetical protein
MKHLTASVVATALRLLALAIKAQIIPRSPHRGERQTKQAQARQTRLS